MRKRQETSQTASRQLLKYGESFQMLQSEIATVTEMLKE